MLGYFLLFGVLPCLYVLSLLFIKSIDDYVPRKIQTSDILNFCNLKKDLLQGFRSSPLGPVGRLSSILYLLNISIG